MFWTYLTRELRRRRRQAIVVALGLALGVGLVVTVSSTSSGVAQAQSTVLHSLYGVGTDITVTQAAAAGSGGPARFGTRPPNQLQAGRRFSRDQILPSFGKASFASSKVAAVAALPHVSQAVGGLSATTIHLTGSFAQAGGTGGAPTTAAGSTGSGSGAPNGAPPIRVSTYTIEGVDVTGGTVGPLTTSSIASGRFFSSTESKAKVAILDQGYAKQKKLSVGSTVTLSGVSYRVIGLASPSSKSASIYLPLARAQTATNQAGQVNEIYVKASSATDIAAVKAEIQKIFPKATVTTASDLASQVTGSLSNASNLSRNFGRWLSIAVLAAAFVLASLLTLSAVSRRVREFGTLKALGWRTRRVVGQVMGEAMAQGVLGGILGIGVGIAGAVLVSRLMPSLTATVGGSASSGPGGVPVPPGLATTHTVTVHMPVAISPELLALAVVLAMAGGLIAGSLGGWRAARLRPAEALRRVE